MGLGLGLGLGLVFRLSRPLRASATRKKNHPNLELLEGYPATPNDNRIELADARQTVVVLGAGEKVNQ